MDLGATDRMDQTAFCLGVTRQYKEDIKISG